MWLCKSRRLAWSVALTSRLRLASLTGSLRAENWRAGPPECRPLYQTYCSDSTNRKNFYVRFLLFSFYICNETVQNCCSYPFQHTCFFYSYQCYGQKWKIRLCERLSYGRRQFHNIHSYCRRCYDYRFSRIVIHSEFSCNDVIESSSERLQYVLS